jgi:hypothetical protein
MKWGSDNISLDGGHRFIKIWHLEPAKIGQRRHRRIHKRRLLRKAIGGNERLRVKDGNMKKHARCDIHRRQDRV